MFIVLRLQIPRNHVVTLPPAFPLDMKAGSTEATLAVKKACMKNKSSCSFGQIITCERRERPIKIDATIHVSICSSSLVQQFCCSLWDPGSAKSMSNFHRLSTL